MKIFAIGVLFVGTLLAASWLTQRSWNGIVYVYVGEQRAPASVRSMQDYSPLDGRALQRSAHAQLMASANLTQKDGQVGVQLGHPLVERTGGLGREFACEVPGHLGVFDRMEITFYGTGVSDSGEEPHMIVDTACRSSAQLNTLDTIWLPMHDIVTSKAQDQELQVPGSHPAIVRLQHIPGEWPTTWVMVSVRFYRDDNPDSSVDSLTIGTTQMRATREALLSFDVQK